MSRVSARVVCNEDQLKLLTGIVQNPRYDKEYVLRAQIILQLNKGLQVKQVSEKLSADPITVRKWRDRFLESGVEGLSNAPRPGHRGKGADSPKKRIQELQNSGGLLNSEEPTSNSAEEISRRTGISTDVIYKLARKGEIDITPMRQTVWSIDADTDTVAKNGSMLQEALRLWCQATWVCEGCKG